MVRFSIILTSLTWVVSLLAAEKEWLYSMPVPVQPPKVTHFDLVRNPIDSFILEQLEVTQLSLAPQASRRILVRRLYSPNA